MVNKIGKQIKRLRESKKISQKELALKIGVTPGYMSKVENGEKIPNIERLIVISEALEEDVSVILGESEQIPTELKEAGVEWIGFISEMKEKNITPDELRAIVSIIKKNR